MIKKNYQNYQNYSKCKLKPYKETNEKYDSFNSSNSSRRINFNFKLNKEWEKGFKIGILVGMITLFLLDKLLTILIRIILK